MAENRTGAVPNLRVIFVVRDTQYQEYGLDALPGQPIDLSLFQSTEASKLFFEMCRFHRQGKRQQNVENLDGLAKAFSIIVGQEGWKAEQLDLASRMLSPFE